MSNLKTKFDRPAPPKTWSGGMALSLIVIVIVPCKLQLMKTNTERERTIIIASRMNAGLYHTLQYIINSD